MNRKERAMLLSHAVLYAEARSYLAALADAAPDFDASLEYERVLLQLDWLHGGQIPPITVVPSGDPDALYNVASTAIGNLERHAVDQLDLELCLAMLDAAWALDRPS
jgi:hypothetical protein